MPCFFAVITYNGCDHQEKVKVDCTKDCANSCDVTEVMVHASTGVSCQSCIRNEIYQSNGGSCKVEEVARLPSCFSADGQSASVLKRQLQNRHFSREERIQLEARERQERLSEAKDAIIWTQELPASVLRVYCQQRDDSQSYLHDVESFILEYPSYVEVVAASGQFSEVNELFSTVEPMGQ